MLRKLTKYTVYFVLIVTSGSFQQLCECVCSFRFKMADPNAPRFTKVNNVENAVGGNDNDPLCDWNVALLTAPKHAAFSIRKLCMLCRFWQIQYIRKTRPVWIKPLINDEAL